jgi:hypothetical protein
MVLEVVTNSSEEHNASTFISMEFSVVYFNALSQ